MIITPQGPRYAPAARLNIVRSMLASVGGVTIYDVAERLPCSPRTAQRYLAALQLAGEPLYTEIVAGKKHWRLTDSARKATLRLTTQQMVTLALCRRVLDFLKGTGFEDDLDEVFAQLSGLLSQQGAAATRRLDRKLYDVNEKAYEYGGRTEDVDQIVSALLREERLDVVYESGRSGDRRAYRLRPYSLVVYKKGLYLIAVEDRDDGPMKAPRLFNLSGFRKVEWRKGDAFPYPRGFHPKRFFAGMFGIIRGERTKVRVRFDAKAAAYVRRRRWHESQVLTRRADGTLDVTLVVDGTVELTSWLLSWGSQVEVLAPASLRARFKAESLAMRRRYLV